ncbi:PLP-dependent aminotransferase family protein [Nonlabens antarcticus]|uniref:PLP-dependent transferase n=1 Tax=Nonlabens antarcticus TaxID=392714 RepID=UPI001890E5D1|nr:PLP-dependent transferase [Nonlabens antarcticus]
MNHSNVMNYIKDIIENMPAGWLGITTHRLDIYNEELAKTEFLEELDNLYKDHNSQTSALDKLPTAYDYIRLGHPLSCVLEWGIGKLNNLNAENVISFSSMTMPVLSILRKNSLENRNTQILYSGDLPEHFDAEILKRVYQYKFDLKKINDFKSAPKFNGSTIFISQDQGFAKIELPPNVDFFVNVFKKLGSILLINGKENAKFISDIQHVRRRETIAMTPADSLQALKLMIDSSRKRHEDNDDSSKNKVESSVNEVTGTTTKALVGSSGLSIQYAIMMGLVDNAIEQHPGKRIKFIVPPNCYGGTNDQARRVAACLDNVDIVDLPVDGDNDMVQSIDKVLKMIASENAVPYIIAEIPTNPRVEVPDLLKLKEVLTVTRKTPEGATAIDPVFILDQTFCPNVHFLGEGEILSAVRTISFASGSKFPSGGKCTAGYCVGNNKTEGLMSKIEMHLNLCDNEATGLQYKILAEQLPSMNERIIEAYKNTREFVNFIHETLPGAKINFVSEELASAGFTPSVFSLDLPTKGENAAEKEAYKRKLNLKLINLMITEIPQESKFCVSYGQVKGCYWTIPATSTQGTTKEGDKDYIVRASLSPNLDLERHKQVFTEFVKSI